MNRHEALGLIEPGIEVKGGKFGYEIRTPSYVAVFHSDTPYIDICDTRGNRWIQALKASTITTTNSSDVTYEMSAPSYTIGPNGEAIITIESTTDTATRKQQTWLCRKDVIETYVTAEASGALQSIQLLGGAIIGENMFGESMSERFFESVFNPQPSECERPIFSAAESSHITTSGMWKPGRRREFLNTPFVYGFNQHIPKQANGALADTWLMVGVSAPIQSQNMVDFCYEAREDGFSLKLLYDSTTLEDGTFTSPSLLLHFASNPLQGLEDFKHYAITACHLPLASAPATPLKQGNTTFVSWGHQLELERQTNHSIPARNFASEEVIEDALKTFEANNIQIDTIVVDDKWQAQYGMNTPDLLKWPNLSEFNHAQHTLGRRVLLWVKLFDPEGLPPDLCILDARGRPIASDPTNPNYLELLRSQIHEMLAADALNADGLKLDFLAQLPHGPGLRWHGNERGQAALHSLMKHVYDQAKYTKPDSVIQAQVVNPWFADTLDQVRLNDTNERHPVVATMGLRAMLAKTLLPDHSIDPDGWPMCDKDSWLEYISAQPNLTGNVTLHFASSVNGEPLTREDYEKIAQATAALKA